VIITDTQPDVTIITPTGDRPEAFALCERWLSRQDYSGRVQVIVVDDGLIPMPCTMEQQHLRRLPQPDDPPHTLAANLRMALPHVAGDRILIVENDDYYGRAYVSTMLRWLDGADLVGEVGAKYYHLRIPGWRWYRSHTHASLCRTGLSRRALPALAEACASDHPSIDMRLWAGWRGSRYAFRDQTGGARLCIGMKGLPGRPSPLHHSLKGYRLDRGFEQLRRWVGDDDARVYVDLHERLGNGAG
jgi:hypothetical protein